MKNPKFVLRALALIVMSVWSHSSGITATPGYEGGRARVDLGVSYRIGAAGTMALSGFYDGIGR